MTPRGLVIVASPHNPVATMDRLVVAVTGRGMTVFARIDHSAGAAAVGLELRATEVLMFGAAKGGTPLMQAAQTSGIDLPLKTLCWRDEDGGTWIAYNDPHWIAERHEAEAPKPVQTMSEVLAAVVREATAPTPGSVP